MAAVISNNVDKGSSFKKNKRFQVLVSDNLSETSGEVIELRHPLTTSMEKIQQSLVECMEATLSQIRRSNPMVIRSPLITCSRKIGGSARVYH